MGKLIDLFWHCVYGKTEELNSQRCQTCGITPVNRERMYDKWLNEYVWWCPRAKTMISKQSVAFTSIVGCIEWIEPKGGVKNE